MKHNQILMEHKLILIHQLFEMYQESYEQIFYIIQNQNIYQIYKLI